MILKFCLHVEVLKLDKKQGRSVLALTKLTSSESKFVVGLRSLNPNREPTYIDMVDLVGDRLGANRLRGLLTPKVKTALSEEEKACYNNAATIEMIRDAEIEQYEAEIASLQATLTTARKKLERFKVGFDQAVPGLRELRKARKVKLTSGETSTYCRHREKDSVLSEKFSEDAYLALCTANKAKEAERRVIHRFRGFDDTDNIRRIASRCSGSSSKIKQEASNEDGDCLLPFAPSVESRGVNTIPIISGKIEPIFIPK